jgi:hypothetical protein
MNQLALFLPQSPGLPVLADAEVAAARSFAEMEKATAHPPGLPLRLRDLRRLVPCSGRRTATGFACHCRGVPGCRGHRTGGSQLPEQAEGRLRRDRQVVGQTPRGEDRGERPGQVRARSAGEGASRPGANGCLVVVGAPTQRTDGFLYGRHVGNGAPGVVLGKPATEPRAVPFARILPCRRGPGPLIQFDMAHAAEGLRLLRAECQHWERAGGLRAGDFERR